MERIFTGGGKWQWKGYVKEEKKDNAWGKYEDTGYVHCTGNGNWNDKG